jgi:hypothetical protein
MAKTVQVVRSADDADLWRVALDGQNLVGFYGPEARFLAHRHRDELAELLGTGEPGDPGDLYPGRDPRQGSN